MSWLLQQWEKLRNSLVHTPQALRLVWQANHVATLGLGFLTIGGALLPATQAWVGKLIVDGVVASIQHGNNAEQARTVFYYLLLELCLFLLSTGINHSRRLIQQLIQLQLANQIRSEIIRKALTLDLAFFEHPDYYDRLQNARREGSYKPVELINDTFQIVQNMITLISFAALMLRFSPWLVLILLATSIPAFIAETRFSEQGFRLLTRRAPETRQINYLARLLTEDTAAKEIKLFNLGNTLLARYMTLFDKFFREDKSLAVRRAVVGFGLGLVATLGFYGSYAWIVWRTVQGSISLGDMTLYLSIFRQGQTTFQSILAGIGNIYENNLFMAHYFEFLELTPQMQVAAPRQKLPVSLIRGIEFRGVGFRYPENDEWVLRGIDLKIPPGEKIALVGHNGAGKTTLIKLLSRLYDPTEGAILIDGIDIRELDPIELQTKDRRDLSRLCPLSFAGQRKHRLRADRSGRPHGQDRRIRPQERRRRDDRRFTRRLSRPCSAAGFTAATSCRSGNGSASRWRAPSCATRRSWSWTSPPPRWMPRPNMKSFSTSKSSPPGKWRS